MKSARTGTRIIALVVFSVIFAASDLHAQFQPPGALGALAPANLAKPRPKPPFDLTGTWLHGGGADNGFRSHPPRGSSSHRKPRCIKTRRQKGRPRARYTKDES